MDWSFRNPVVVAVIGVSATLILALIVVTALLLTGDPAAVPANAPLIGALLALGGVFTTQMVNTGLANRSAQETRNLEAQRAQETALQKYLEEMGNLLVNNQLSEAKPGENLGVIARAHTLTVLEGLDPARKRVLMLFLVESNLIGEDKGVVNLNWANLSGVDLSGTRMNLSGTGLLGANLSNARLPGVELRSGLLEQINLSNADLSGANLSGKQIGSGVGLLINNLANANLSGANLSGANLNNAELNSADLSGADLREANLEETNLYKANVINTNLSGARMVNTYLGSVDLRESMGLTQEQVEQAIGNVETRVPRNIQRPEAWSRSPQEQRREARLRHLDT